MRVTHIITRLVIGGAQENTVASVLGLRQKPGVEVRLLSGPTTGPEGSLEPEVVKIPGLFTIVPELVRPVQPLKDWLALRRLEKILREQKPGIVHTHSGKAGILGRLAASRAAQGGDRKRHRHRPAADRQDRRRVRVGLAPDRPVGAHMHALVGEPPPVLTPPRPFSAPGWACPVPIPRRRAVSTPAARPG